MPDEIIDLRSDTTTKPTPEMRRVMYEAEVGDDGFGDDPNINALQEKVALLLGKEAAVWLPSGTMSNQVALRALCPPGSEAIVEADTHLWHYEMGASAALAGVILVRVRGERGILRADDIADVIRPDLPWFPDSGLICVENTHNRAGGVPWPIDDIKAISELATSRGIPMFLDGARLFNASVATGVPVSEYAGYFDAVTVCMCKGLGAPAGSVLCGSAEFIARAHQIRQMMGGIMRQVGILAAAALYALDNNVERLAGDHRRARQLAEMLKGIPKIEVNADDVPTNIVVIDVSELVSPIAVTDALAKLGILIVPFGNTGVRCVTHLGIDDEDIERAATAFAEVAASM
ncbi:MAG: aminotransferase class I/II-fold pyridoxal phosphate-dependent enzyme [bacterium]|nr:aminotransferase class I/II-fold pyridoxal phosphate-dependent enzyme [bacterium]